MTRKSDIKINNVHRASSDTSWQPMFFINRHWGGFRKIRRILNHKINVTCYIVVKASEYLILYSHSMFSITLSIKTHKSKEIIDITDEVQEVIDKEHIKDGQCFLFLTHTTAALTTADLDPGTDLDFLDFLEKIIPRMNFRHPHNPVHTPNHILSSIIGASLVVPVRDEKLVLGTWQRIVLVEFDGPRSRNIIFSLQP